MMAQERELRAKLKELREHIGQERRQCRRALPNEARKMYYGDIEHRPIYGEASPDEARALIEEGVEVTPLRCCRATGTDAARVIPGRCEASNPESRGSPMRNCASEVRSLCSRPGTTADYPEGSPMTPKRYRPGNSGPSSRPCSRP